MLYATAFGNPRTVDKEENHQLGEAQLKILVDHHLHC